MYIYDVFFFRPGQTGYVRMFGPILLLLIIRYRQPGLFLITCFIEFVTQCIYDPHAVW